MKKLIGFLLMLILWGNSHFANAQMRLQLPYSPVADEPIGIDLTVKTARLSNGIQLECAEQGSFSGTPVIFLHGLSDSWYNDLSQFIKPVLNRVK